MLPLLYLLVVLSLLCKVTYLRNINNKISISILRQGSQEPDISTLIKVQGEPSFKPNFQPRNISCCSSVYPINIPLAGSGCGAYTTHIIVDGINQSKFLHWSDSPNQACLLADINIKRKLKNTDTACTDVSNKIIKAHSAGQKLFLFSYHDRPNFTCDPFRSESIDRMDIQYGKRSMTVGRGDFQPGRMVNYSNYEMHSRGPVFWLPFSVRTDQVLEMMRLTKENNATTAGTFSIREGELPYLPRLPREIDGRVFRNYNNDSDKKQTSMRAQMAGKVLEIAQAHPSLNIRVGTVGSTRVTGRTTIQPDYVKGLLSAKVVVLCQPNGWEGHYRFFEAMAAGALVMTDPSIHLPSGYVDGVNVVVYSISDLEQKLLYYIEHDEKRIEVASKGWELAMTKHRSWNRMEDFILNGCNDSQVHSEKKSQQRPKGGKVIFHVGPHKTGSTAIQSSLKQGSLVADNYVSLESRGGVLVDIPLFNTLTQCLNGKCPVEIQHQLQKARNNSLNIVLSSEQFDSNRPVEQIGRTWYMMLESLFHDFESIHVVVVYRRFFEWILSYYAQRRRCGWNKWSSSSLGRGPRGVNTNFVTFLASIGARGFYVFDKYFVSTYEKFSGHFNTTLINIHAERGDAVENFFCHPVLDAPSACLARREQSVEEVHASFYQVLLIDEIVIAAYDESLIDASITRSEARDFFLSTVGGSTQDLPMVCPPEEEIQALLQLSMQAEQKYFPSFYDTPQGKETLMQKFETMLSNRNFCSLDSTAMLADSRWKNALLELNRSARERRK